MGQIFTVLLAASCTAIEVADELCDFTCDPPVAPPAGRILTNLIWMYHMGTVQPIALVQGRGKHGDHGGLWDLLWAPTGHALNHRSFQPRCMACKIRERYRAAQEALQE